MKKIISLICCVAVLLSLTATVSFAETANFSVAVSATEVNVGDTVTVVLKNSEMTATSVTGGFYFDKELLTCESITDARGRVPGVGYLQDDFDDWYKATAFTDVATANEKGAIGIAVAGTSNTNFVALDVATVVFTAKAAGTVNFSIYESTAGTDKVNVDGVNPVSLIIKSAAPELDEEKTVAANPVIDDAAETKTFAVTVGADLVGTGVTAVLAHPTHGEQEVGLTFDGWTGGAKAVFDVVVKFLDFANAADTTLTLK